MSRKIGFASALLFLATQAATAGVPQYTFTSIDGNGRTLQELRLGGAPTVAGGPNNSLLLVAVTNGPTVGTTSLIATQLPNSFFATPPAAPNWQEVVASGSVFSLGGGCARAGRVDFPYINNNRPQILRFENGQFTVVTPAIAGTSRYDSADCLVLPDKSATIFHYNNRDRFVLEMYRELLSPPGHQPLQANAITNVVPPFGGGLRPHVFYDPNQGVEIVVTRTSGQTHAIEMNPTTGVLGATCPLNTSPPPTGFTRPREIIGLAYRNSGNLRRMVIADLDNNGTTERFEFGPACVVTPTTVGSSNGGGPYNWTGYALAQGPERSNPNVLWGDYFYVDTDNNGFLPTAVTPPPFPARGGPFTACNAHHAEAGRNIVAATATPDGSRVEFARVAPTDEVILRAGQEDDVFVEWCLTLLFNL